MGCQTLGGCDLRAVTYDENVPKLAKAVTSRAHPESILLLEVVDDCPFLRMSSCLRSSWHCDSDAGASGGCTDSSSIALRLVGMFLHHWLGDCEATVSIISNGHVHAAAVDTITAPLGLITGRVPLPSDRPANVSGIRTCGSILGRRLQSVARCKHGNGPRKQLRHIANLPHERTRSDGGHFAIGWQGLDADVDLMLLTRQSPWIIAGVAIGAVTVAYLAASSCNAQAGFQGRKGTRGDVESQGSKLILVPVSAQPSESSSSSALCFKFKLFNDCRCQGDTAMTRTRGTRRLASEDDPKIRRKRDRLRTGLWMLLALLSCPTHGAVPASERQALVDLFEATNGGSWRATCTYEWLTGDPCRNRWARVYCDDESTTVT